MTLVKTLSLILTLAVSLAVPTHIFAESATPSTPAADQEPVQTTTPAQPVTAEQGTTEQAASAESAPAEQPSEQQSPEAGPAPESVHTTVQFQTSLGNFTVQLNPERAPQSVENFLKYVDAGFYNDTLFHRVIPGFMVQGGGFTETMAQKPTRPAITNESDNSLRNVRGTVAMARTAQVHSATAQFFVNLVDNPHLDYQQGRHGYAVFGEVIEGMDVIDRIAGVATTTRSGMANVPTEPVVVRQATR
jgi:peptidyl-prolyl cis-trans isomerase A (cyclophilin A)